MSEFFQSPDPAGAPDPVTPQAGPGDAAGWAQVAPHGRGPAPYDIAAPQDIAGITGAFSAAGALSAGAENDIYPSSPRQHEAQALLESPQGAQAMSVISGFPDYESTDVRPGANMENPVQGHGDYPGTTQDVAGYNLGGGIGGVPPEAGGTGPGGGDYPGTTQSGLPVYGTG
jgi:hypothetical protein